MLPRPFSMNIFIIFGTMKASLRQVIVLLMTVSIVCLTTEVETYFWESDNHFITKIMNEESQGDIEHSHLEHHTQHDLYKDVNCFFLMHKESAKHCKVLTSPHFQANFFTKFWRPPELS